MPTSVAITAAYAFFPLTAEELPLLQAELKAFGTEQGMKGLVLLAPEGVNSTVCGTPEAIHAWKQRLRALRSDIAFKDSSADGLVFRRWSVKVKPELITFKQPGVAPRGAHKHLSPAAWRAMLARDDVVVVDTRNTYETAIGAFRGALAPDIRHFTEFPDAIRAAAIPKDKTVLLYCTGGIRCEKAVYTMEQQGYESVYQLDGGILAYLEEYPDDAFEGECFVFDHRVAVDQHLRPSRTYRLCAVCGDPAKSERCERCAQAVPSAA